MSSTTVERFTITGDLASAVFESWIERHARRLGLSASISDHEPTRMKVRVEGPAELVDAMEVGCLLGPIEVWVDDIARESLNSPAGAGMVECEMRPE